MKNYLELPDEERDYITPIGDVEFVEETKLAQGLELCEGRDPMERRFADPESMSPTHVYELEARDPKHRMGNILYFLQMEYEHRPNPGRDFHRWVDLLPVADFRRILEPDFTAFSKLTFVGWNKLYHEFQSGVKYKLPSRLDKYRVHIENGLLKRRGVINDAGKWIDTGTIENFSTTNLRSFWTGAGFAIWAESRQKHFFTNRMRVRRFQHTSFLSGRSVRAAGEWKVEDGVLKEISGKSGHYCPTLSNLLAALADLRDAQLYLGDAKVLLHRRVDNEAVRVGVRDLFAEPRPRLRWKVDPQEAGYAGATASNATIPDGSSRVVEEKPLPLNYGRVD